MRGAFGLVSLLVVGAIIALLFAKYSIPAAQEGKKAQDQVRQYSGRDDDGTPAERTIKLDAEPGSGPLKDLVVLSVTPGGGMEKFYGLRAGDKITAIGDVDVATLLAGGNDPDFGREMLAQEGFSKKKPITVIRDGQTMQLPSASGAPLSTGNPNPQNQQPDSSGGAKPSSPLQDQLNLIKGAGQ
ncbi:MAG TPA: hypothetical protein VH370_23405 [Humisphaera sp.]|jgi:S1-C subfamily serine protease|nr:hypothetical protein [Humisphaera sp.]